MNNESTKSRRNGILTKEELIAASGSGTNGSGTFIYDPTYQSRDLDGKEARRYLESKGFTVVRNYDTGRNGLAITDCGIHLSTNGYIYKK